MSQIENLGLLVNNTSGATLTIAPNEEGWTAYLVQKKKKFNNTSHEVLVSELIKYIEKNRVPQEIGGKIKKPFKLN